MTGRNVREHGDTRFNRLADNLERSLDILLPLFILLLMIVIVLAIVGGIVALTVEALT